MNDSIAIDLLRGLVQIESLSHQEEEATEWLVAQMHAAGYAQRVRR